MAEGDIVASTVVDGLPTFVCGPCGTGTCCLYPFTDPFGVPAYPATDLPDSVLIGVNTLNKVAVGSGVESDYEYGDRNNPPWLVADPNHVGAPWVYNDGTIIDDSLCLIGTYLLHSTNVEDFFTDTYIINALDTIIRTTPCLWSGPKTGGGVWTLNYGLTTPYKWHLTSTGGSPTSDDKTSPQSSPTGSYGLATVA